MPSSHPGADSGYVEAVRHDPCEAHREQKQALQPCSAEPFRAQLTTTSIRPHAWRASRPYQLGGLASALAYPIRMMHELAVVQTPLDAHPS